MRAQKYRSACRTLSFLTEQTRRPTSRALPETDAVLLADARHALWAAPAHLSRPEASRWMAKRLRAELLAIDAELYEVWSAHLMDARRRHGFTDEAWWMPCRAIEYLLVARGRKVRATALEARWRAWRVLHLFADRDNDQIAQHEGCSVQRVRTIRRQWAAS